MTIPKILIREETKDDAAAITEVTVAAFESMEISYRKFGFKNIAGLAHKGVPQEVFFALSFDGHFPHGIVTFHEGFKARKAATG